MPTPFTGGPRRKGNLGSSETRYVALGATDLAKTKRKTP
jgi:hypothetical protein